MKKDNGKPKEETSPQISSEREAELQRKLQEDKRNRFFNLEAIIIAPGIIILIGILFFLVFVRPPLTPTDTNRKDTPTKVK